MGMYTELHLNVELKKDIPNDITETLKCMIGESNKEIKPKKEHPLFLTHGWKYMLQMDSYYFDADTKSSLRFDDISKSYYFNTQCNLKNYNNEIEKFIDWIKPYVETKGFWGFSRYEEEDTPTLIFGKEKETIQKKVEGN